MDQEPIKEFEMEMTRGGKVVSRFIFKGTASGAERLKKRLADAGPSMQERGSEFIFTRVGA
jgi:hypothetical protein